MATRRNLRLTRWDAPQRLAEQLSQLERTVESIDVSGLPSQMTVDASLIQSGVKRKLIMPNRDINLGEKHRLDPWLVLSEDFLMVRGTIEPQGGFISFIIGTGASRGMSAGDVNHPGTYTSIGGTAANSGVAVSAGTIVIGGDEYVLCVFRTPAAFTNTSSTIGFYNDRTTLTEPTRGVYIRWSGSGVVKGYTAINSVYEATVSEYTLTEETWYTALVKVARDGSSALFKVYSDSGVLLWQDTVRANVPYLLSHHAGVKQGVVASDSGYVAGAVDFLEVRIGGPNRPLQRYLGSTDDILS